MVVEYIFFIDECIEWWLKLLFCLQFYRKIKMESNLTPSSSQNSNTNSQTSRDNTNPTWEHVSKEKYTNGRKALICLYCKKVAKCGGIYKMKQHLTIVKWDIALCKSVTPDVRFWMENSLQEFVNSKKATQEA